MQKKSNALHSFVLLGLCGFLFSGEQGKPPIKEVPALDMKKLSAQFSLDAEKRKSEYEEQNEKLKGAWLTHEKEISALLEKTGKRAADIQQQTKEDIAKLSKDTFRRPNAKDTSTTADPNWQRLTQLSDFVSSQLTREDPIWSARTNDHVRRTMGANFRLEPDPPQLFAVTPSVSINSNTVVTHYTMDPNRENDDRRNDFFRTSLSDAKYSYAGAEYDSSSVSGQIHVPLTARSVRIVLRDCWMNAGMRNFVLFGYGSTENKFTIQLTSFRWRDEGPIEYARASQSLQRSVFLVAGYIYERVDRSPTVELTWTRPPGNDEQYLALRFIAESWAGGGPFGSLGDAYCQMQVRSFDVITNSA
jgi:hypothetical protein